MNAWDNIIGHDWAVEVLSAAIEHNRVGHAYLITGPEQVGKTTLAVTFAQALNCTHADNRPCGTCRSCQLIASGRHPDVTIVEPEISARGKASIKIEAMRELQRSLQLAAYEGPYKIAIISGFDAANMNAANAFLKTLEEPPANTVLILTATDGDTLLDTIKSRCRVVAIRPIAIPIIEQALCTRWQIAPERAKQLAHLANGRLGWALQAAEQGELLAHNDDQLSLLQTILQQNLVERFQQAEALAKQPEKLAELLNVWLTWWRDLLMVASDSAESATINIVHQAQFAQLATIWPLATIKQSLNQTLDTLWQLDHNVNIRLAMETLLLSYPQQRVVAL